MRKVIAAINMTLDGFCDHTAGVPDKEIHEHYKELLNASDVILYGRITYQLMEYWKMILQNPSGQKATDDFASAINKIPKIVFSNTLENAGWETAKLAVQSLEESVRELKQQPGKEILIGSRSLILQLIKQNLIDEYQFCIHPVVIGSGLPLFEKVEDGYSFKLLKTKVFGSGAVILYYQPGEK